MTVLFCGFLIFARQSLKIEAMYFMYIFQIYVYLFIHFIYLSLSILKRNRNKNKTCYFKMSISKNVESSKKLVL